MASVSDVFKQLKQEAHTLLNEEEVVTPEEYCMLESDTTRRIIVPEKYSILGVESDEKVKTVKFAFPRYVDDGRLNLSDYQIRINYMTANPDTENNKDQVQAQNVHTVGEYIVFEWLLSRRVTQYKGTITFIVCAITANDDGTITTEWNTTLATSQSIEGLEVSLNENEETQVRDLLTELLANLNNSKNDAITEITQTKTQAISDVEAEGQTQISAVDAKGGQVLESIPDDYTTLENRVDELEQNRAYVIVGNGSGEFVTLNDSSELKTRNAKLFGKSVQSETTGTQLFNINKLKELDDGVEIIDYSTGEMEINQQNNAMLPVRLFDICPNMVAGQTYYLTGETTSNNKYLLVGIKQWNFNETLVPEESDLLAQCNFKCTTQTGQSGEIIYYKDTFKHIMIVEGTTEKPYEVYTGGEAATEPTPDYPLPITSAGNYDDESEKYEIGIGVTGKNLFDINGNKYANESGNTYAFVIYVKQNTEYTLSSNCPNYNDEGQGNTASLYFNGGSSTINGVGNGNPKTVNTGNNKSLIINVRFNADSGGINLYEKVINGDYWVMLNEGNKPNIYTPYVGQNSIVSISNKLKGIPVDSGGNYTDVEGQQWLCDYIDRERGKYVQCVKEVVFDGNENWSYQTEYRTFAYTGFGGDGIENRACICDRFFSKQGVNPQTVDYLCCGFHNQSIYSNTFYFKAVGEIEFNQSSDFKKWLSNNPTTIIYQLKDLIETDLTPDQLAALDLSTYQDITNIGTDTMPQVGIDVEYIADTKTYIDNAIAEAIAAIPTE